ncbi:hypothetical protein AHF37_08816 [Paragonimus kellicotti]|nr:hypothetical protein AHF37_08816 [Paragonimus kellicotti]
MNDSLPWEQRAVLINLPNLCKTPHSSPVHLLVLIKSALTHTVRRKAIRKLWANNNCWKDLTVRHVFLLGTTINQSRAQNIIQESRRFADLIQQDFLDHYYNNTLKVLFGLEWALAFCPETQWLLFVDDDMFVNPRNVISILHSLNSSPVTNLLLGAQRTHSEVMRNAGKWNIGEDDYPHSHYPTYVSGAAIFIGAELALDLYICSRFTKVIPFDDVYFGLLLNKLLHFPLHLLDIYLGDPQHLTKSVRSKKLVMHNIRSQFRQKKMWDELELFMLC